MTTEFVMSQKNENHHIYDFILKRHRRFLKVFADFTTDNQP